MDMRGSRAPLVVVALFICGCTNKSSQDSARTEAFLDQLRHHNIVFTDGIAVAALGAPSAKIMASKAVSEGIDLMALYKAHPNERPVRLALAYLLVLSESEPYLEFVRAHAKRELSSGEIRVCVHAVESSEWHPSAHYTAAVISALSDSDETSARLCVARYDVSQGHYQVAIRRILQIMTSNDYIWEVPAVEVLMTIPPTDRFTILEPYLKTETLEGVHAAFVIGQDPQHDGQAVSYLRGAAASPDVSVAREARRALSEFREYRLLRAADRK